MFASFLNLATISLDSEIIELFLILDCVVPDDFDAIPKFSLIDLLGVVFFFLEIVNVSLTVSYINLASLVLSALSKVSTTRTFCV